MNQKPDLESLRNDVGFDGFRWSGNNRDVTFYLRRPPEEKGLPSAPVNLVCKQTRELEFGMSWTGIPETARSWDIDYVGSEKHGWFVKMDYRPHGSINFYCKSIEIAEN